MYGHLSPRQFGVGELRDDFRCVSHAVLTNSDPREGISSQTPQSVMGIGQLEPRGESSHEGRGFENDALQQARLRSLIQKPRSVDDSEIVLLGTLHHRYGFQGIVLTIGVEGHDVCAIGLDENVVETRLQRGALTEVDGMLNDDRARLRCQFRGVVSRPIVDAHNVWKEAQGFGDDIADDLRLVVQGYDKPGIVYGCGTHRGIVAGVSGKVRNRPHALGGLMASRIVDSADVSEEAVIGDGSSVWHLAQVREGVTMGKNCIVGRGAYIGTGVTMGDNCKVQNYALVYEPAELGHGVFIGPAVVLTNDHNPRAINPDGSIKSGEDWEPVGVTIKEGAAIGARAVCVAPVTIGKWATVAAGAVVVKDVPDFALVAGVPARQIGWVSKAGVKLEETAPGIFTCPKTGIRYELVNGKLKEEKSK